MALHSVQVQLFSSTSSSTTAEMLDAELEGEPVDAAVDAEVASETTEANEKQDATTEPLEGSVPVNTEKVIGAAEKMEFQAETRQLLDIVSRAIYTDTEVFVRELISNASDASEQARYAMNTGAQELVDADLPLEIRIYCDPDNNTITFADNGIGMTREQLSKNLGTIARSGSKNFIKELEGSAAASESSTPEKGSAIIGQFGVGFYSAFMVSSRVEVFSQSAVAGDSAHYWCSSGSTGEYEISEAEGVHRGTKIVVHLNDESTDFADKKNVERVIKRYSNFVTFPVFINDKRVNVHGALWGKSPSSISDEEHTEFYKYMTNSYDAPLHRLHFRADAPLDISALVYVSESHTEKYGMGRMDPGVSVYSRRILIKPNAPEILPDWLRFLKGAVDSEDIPLNLSRESMQDSRLIKRLNTMLTKRLIAGFVALAKQDDKKFTKFYKEYAQFLKEGMCTDFVNKDDIAKLLRFDSSTNSDMRSLDEYITSMHSEQSQVYYTIAGSREQALGSPYLEAFKKKGTEVLFCYSGMDDPALRNLGTFNGRNIVNIEGSDIADSDIDTEWKRGPSELTEAQTEDLTEWMEKTLSHRVTSVKSTQRLDESPALVVDHESATTRYLMRLTNQDRQFDLKMPKQKLEINPRHQLIRGLYYTMEEDEELAGKVAEQVFDNALISAGLMDDPRDMIKRMNDLLSIAMDVEGIEKELSEKQTDAEVHDDAVTGDDAADAELDDNTIKDAEVESSDAQNTRQ